MKKTITSVLLFVSLFSFQSIAREKIVIYHAPGADPLEIQAALILHEYLSRLFTGYSFEVTGKLPKNQFIAVGCYASLNKDPVFEGKIRQPENNGFRIESITGMNLVKKVIVGATPRAAIDAIYALLENLGYGFYFSYDTQPPIKKSIRFDDWDMTDYPLVNERIVFNWHNFLSGCSGWSFKDWKTWIDQSSKMRYNTIMVHAYGNNPMFQFEMNGLVKPVGFMNTSVSGRDWSGQHVNDVRRLPGGSIFNEAILGSEAAKVTADKRSEAAIRLMQQVMEYAHSKGMGIIYAHDIDTWAANPQNIILSLPLSARFRVGEFWLANPEETEGYAFYKAQVKKLMNDYPYIGKLALWVRWSHDVTPWRSIRKGNMPLKWQTEYYEMLAREWEVLDDNRSVSTFAISKIVEAYQKAFKELGFQDIELLYGSWGWDDMVPSNHIIPKDVGFIPLDWWINFEYEASRKKLESIGQQRKLIPIVWAHHDDHRYIGRPYTPFDDFADRLYNRKASGFGIIHWTTFPLDLYFSSLSRQVWNRTKNEKLPATINSFTDKHWGIQSSSLNDYFYAWITQGPMFGRETSDHFMDLGGSKTGRDDLENPDTIIHRAQSRLDILQKTDFSKINRNRNLLEYFNEMEYFYIDFFRNHQHFNRAFDALATNNINEALEEMQQTNCEEVIANYAKILLKGPATQSEKCLVFSMGTRLLPDYVNMEQRLLLKPVRYRFAETQHDSLAQSPGRYSWFVDDDKILWRILGKKELQMEHNPQFVATDEYIASAIPIMLELTTISGNNLPTGTYTLLLECGSPSGGIPSFDVFDTADKPLEYSAQSKGRHTLIQFSVPMSPTSKQIIIHPKETLHLYCLTISKK